jgi:protein-ribulosamine 3-kinase
MKLLPFTEHIISLIQEKTNQPVIFRHITPEHGGSINESFKIETSAGNFFLKKNDAKLFPGMFQKELEGLNALKKSETLHVPEIISDGIFESEQFLILRFVEKGMHSKTFWEDFGHGLAQLHKNSQDNFGWDSDNYIGSIHQKNTNYNSWNEFFVHCRLEPLVALALNQKKLNHVHYDLFQNLYKKIDNYFPNEKPALLHGDFWNGNFMPDADGHPLIFDPAVYYGHREMDIAMSMLFGGFHQKFYSAYQESFTLENGWKDRARLANLYPLMVHVNLFGGSYLTEVEATLKAFQ